MERIRLRVGFNIAYFCELSYKMVLKPKQLSQTEYDGFLLDL